MKAFKIDSRLSGVSLAAMAVMMAMPGVAQAQAATAPATAQDTPATQDDADVGPDVVVTGFRGSLAKALNQKKNEAAATDSILAEDIGKFPDLNLSESIQRIPGVALLRDGGEGRSISVRGLGPQFTRVRINGLEAIATAGGSDPSGGTNRGRGFDFNVFAADLFNSITVRKSAEATTEEGSLGATVDLRTARPFDYNGFTLVASAQGSYNDLAQKASPRAAFLISDTFADGTLGALFSVAYTKRKLIEEGFSTVRWAPNFIAANGTNAAVTNFTPGFESVLGTTCVPVGAGGASGTAITPAPAVCTEANAAFHPRFPRYDYFVDDQERIGATASIQWRPSDDTLISIDGLYADFKATRQEQYLEANGFSVSGGCTATSRPTNCGIADTDVIAETITNGVMTAGKFDDVDLRVENRFDKLDTKFKQITGEITQKFGDAFTVNLLAGHSSSKHTNPMQNTITFDQYNVDGYSYDFGADGRSPVFGFGTAKLTDPTAWTLSQIRLRSATAENTYDTAQLNLTWKVTDGFDVLVGGAYKKYGFATSFLQRSNGTTSSQDTNVACCVADPLSNYSQVVNLGGTNVLIPDYFAAQKYFDLTNPTARGGAFKLGTEPGLGSNSSVTEKDKSGYLQVNFTREIGGMTLRGNAGVRYVQTHQTANGYGFLGGAVTPISVSRTYEDWLPAMNVVLEATPEFLIRGSIAKVMARPDLGSLPPGVTVAVSGANRTVSSGNPLLDPFRATTYDLSLEWYYQTGALLSVAFFQKDINSFVQTLPSSGVFSANPFGLPDSLAIAACGTSYPATCSPAFPNWTFSVPVNTPGGRLRGIEVNFQQPLKFLPGFLSNTGVLLNYTHVTSKIQYLSGNPAVVVATDNLTGLSPNAANGTFYYEDKFLSARVSAAWRSTYLTRIPGQQGANLEGTKGTLNIDASMQFTINQHLKLSLEAINLTDQYQDQYVDSRSLLTVYHHTGREFLFGVRYTY